MMGNTLKCMAGLFRMHELFLQSSGNGKKLYIIKFFFDDFHVFHHFKKIITFSSIVELKLLIKKFPCSF
jgi:hypothetical protein